MISVNSIESSMTGIDSNRGKKKKWPSSFCNEIPDFFFVIVTRFIGALVSQVSPYIFRPVPLVGTKPNKLLLKISLQKI